MIGKGIEPENHPVHEAESDCPHCGHANPVDHDQLLEQILHMLESLNPKQ